VLTRLPKPAARWSRLFALGVLVGVLSGLAAAAFERGLHEATSVLIGTSAHLGTAEILRFEWKVLLLPALGGLVSGVLVRSLCPDAVGHGTDMLTRAFHRRMGDLPLRGPFVKGLASIGVIACGGSAGPEGPNAALGAAIGSGIGRLFHLAPRERRILLVSGCAAAIGAIFRCPLGGAIFAASVLYEEEEFEAEAIVPSFVASVIGYSTFMTIWGGLGGVHHLLSGADKLGFHSAAELVVYAVLGPLCGLAASFFSICLRFVEERVVPRSKLPVWLAPAFGGLATGAVACALPQVMDSRYHFIQAALDGLSGPAPTVWWWAGLFGAVCAAKCIATALTVGSGGSGGALGPSVFIGGCVGACLGALLEASFPGAFPPDSPLRKALIPVGMGGVLAAAMRTPLAAIVMVTEMTGSYGLIVPLMLSCMSAYVVGRRWGINREQVRSSAESPAHAGDALVNLLEAWKVEQLMERNWPQTVPPNATLAEILAKVHPGTRPVFAVARDDRLLGLISVTDIRRIMEQPGVSEAIIVSDIMTESLETVEPRQDVYSALERFRRSNHDVLPVVSSGAERRWCGMLLRETVFAWIQRALAETHRSLLREHAGLAAVSQEGELQLLVMGVSPLRKDMIQRLMVPMDAVGKSLRETDFRRQYHAQVVAIEQPDGSIQCPPDLDQPLVPSQRLVAVVYPPAPGSSPIEAGPELPAAQA